MNKIPTQLRLTEEEREYLNTIGYGSTSIGVRRLIAEAKSKSKQVERLKWLSERLINKYGENKNLDYHISAREL